MRKSDVLLAHVRRMQDVAGTVPGDIQFILGCRLSGRIEQIMADPDSEDHAMENILTALQGVVDAVRDEIPSF
jgi:DNA polymerase II small subunit/DNA polymerase delta subunit B